LGTTTTDQSGCFRIIYRTEAFQDLFEERPDLYLKVRDDQENDLYSSEAAIRPEAGSVETFDVTVEQKPDSNEGQVSQKEE
jgi:hypothetical protein